MLQLSCAGGLMLARVLVALPPPATRGAGRMHTNTPRALQGCAGRKLQGAQPRGLGRALMYRRDGSMPFREYRSTMRSPCRAGRPRCKRLSTLLGAAGRAFNKRTYAIATPGCATSRYCTPQAGQRRQAAGRGH